MAKIKLVSTDGKEVIETNNARYIQFVKDMKKAGMPWKFYHGPENNPVTAPAVLTAEGRNEADITGATTVKGFSRDTEGMELIVYPTVE